jgi:Putative peptidoglycan-binding domain-containing protein
MNNDDQILHDLDIDSVEGLIVEENEENTENGDRALSDVPVGQRPTLRQGDSGEWVTELQTELRQLTFYTGAINGNFDSNTAEAVRDFQKNNKITVDGVVGRETWSSLIFLYAPLATCPGSGLMPTTFKGLVIDAGHDCIGNSK